MQEVIWLFLFFSCILHVLIIQYINVCAQSASVIISETFHSYINCILKWLAKLSSILENKHIFHSYICNCRMKKYPQRKCKRSDGKRLLSYLFILYMMHYYLIFISMKVDDWIFKVELHNYCGDNIHSAIRPKSLYVVLQSNLWTKVFLNGKTNGTKQMWLLYNKNNKTIIQMTHRLNLVFYSV